MSVTAKSKTLEKLSISEMNKMIIAAGPALMPSDSLHVLLQHVYELGQNIRSMQKKRNTKTN